MNSYKIRWAIFCLVLSTTTSIFSQGLPLSHNLDESLNTAKAEGKNVLMLFSGSDWCKPCIQLRKNIIETSSFISYARENLVILELDFPYSKKNKLPKEQKEHNEWLAETFNKEGSFPKMILLDQNQRSLGVVPYRKKDNTDALISEINKIIGI
tara:strand:- start:11692 stop:12153 length:462 start_codon:yes stop_codon:yes gene_type:complete